MKTGNRGQGSGVRLVVALAVVVLAGCASPPPPQFTDADWVSHSTTGRGGYERGDYRRAADAYGRAQERARALDDADALAVAAVNRALCLIAAGEPTPAVAAVNEALADARVSGNRRAELLAAGARAEAAAGNTEAALNLVGVALKENPSSTIQAQVMLAGAKAELAKDGPAAAAKILDGLAPKEWSRLPASLRAEETELRARIAAAAERPAEAKDLLDDAAAHWKKAGRLPEMARALAEAGRQAKAAGDLAGACDRFWRAARSLWAQGIKPDAVKILEEGVACAEELKDDAASQRLADLFVTFKTDGRLSK